MSNGQLRLNYSGYGIEMYKSLIQGIILPIVDYGQE